jgi:hypothetical protein
MMRMLFLTVLLSFSIAASATTTAKNYSPAVFALARITDSNAAVITSVVGAGAGGANVGFWIGKTTTYVVCHGTITAVCTAVGMVNGPAGVALGHALELHLAGPIEVLSNTVGIGMGIGLGTTTGPL